MRRSLTAAVIGITALLALAFASSGASAATVLCKSPTGACPEAETYPANTAIKASQTTSKVKLLTNIGITVECNSTLEGETTAQGGKPLPVKITALSFSNCNCEVKVLALPSSSAIELTSAPNGAFSFEGSKVLIECFNFFHCVYTYPPTLTFQGGSPATLTAEKVSVKGTTEFCPTTTLDAKYSVEAPKPVYVEESL
jgi:hypothetical protein